MESKIISLSRFVPSQGRRLFLLILIPGLPEPNRKNKEKIVLRPFLFVSSRKANNPLEMAI